MTGNADDAMIVATVREFGRLRRLDRRLCRTASSPLPPNELIEFLTVAFKRAADRLRTEGHEEPWQEDLWAADIVRLLRERSREVIAKMGNQDERA